MRLLSALRMCILISRDVTSVYSCYVMDSIASTFAAIIQISCIVLAIQSIADVPLFLAIVPDDKDLQQVPRRGQARGHHSDQHPREAAQAGGPVRPPRLLRLGDLPGLRGGIGDSKGGDGAGGDGHGIGRERHEAQRRRRLCTAIGCSLPSRSMLYFGRWCSQSCEGISPLGYWQKVNQSPT